MLRFSKSDCLSCIELPSTDVACNIVGSMNLETMVDLQLKNALPSYVLSRSSLITESGKAIYMLV